MNVFYMVLALLVVLSCSTGDRDNPFDPDGDAWNPQIQEGESSVITELSSSRNLPSSSLSSVTLQSSSSVIKLSSEQELTSSSMTVVSSSEVTLSSSPSIVGSSQELSSSGILSSQELSSSVIQSSQELTSSVIQSSSQLSISAYLTSSSSFTALSSVVSSSSSVPSSSSEPDGIVPEVTSYVLHKGDTEVIITWVNPGEYTKVQVVEGANAPIDIDVGAGLKRYVGLTNDVQYNFKLQVVGIHGGVSAGQTLQVTPTATGVTNFLDGRDSTIYEKIDINGQMWMAENLNYVLDGAFTTWCTGGVASNCDLYGTMYDWATAMAIDSNNNTALWNGSDVNHQGLCPVGWHIPSDAEWQVLVGFVESDNGCGGGGNCPAYYLKSSTGWFDNGSGNDKYGFNALPTAKRFESQGTPQDYSYVVNYWSATEATAINTWAENLYYPNSAISRANDIKLDGNFIRCLED